MIVCERFRRLHGPKAPEDFSSYAARLWKENFVVIYIEQYLKDPKGSGGNFVNFVFQQNGNIQQQTNAK